MSRILKKTRKVLSVVVLVVFYLDSTVLAHAPFVFGSGAAEAWRRPSEQPPVERGRPAHTGSDDESSQAFLVSVSSEERQGNEDSDEPSSSADGRWIAFESSASNLVREDHNGVQDIFVRDRANGTTRRVSVASSGHEACDLSEDAAISSDGRFVAFESKANNLVERDTNGKKDVFVHDLATGKTVRVSITSGGEQANDDSGDPSISGDGRYVVFESRARNLVSKDTNKKEDVFVFDRQTGDVTLVSAAASGKVANAESGDPFITPDGRYIAFESEASNLVPGDTNQKKDIFVYGRETGEMTRVSVDTSGRQADRDSAAPVLSSDGRFVAFESEATNLVGGDRNRKRDIFVHDRETGETVRASVGTDGREADDESEEPAINATGRFVVFESDACNLVPGEAHDHDEGDDEDDDNDDDNDDDDEEKDVFVRDLKRGITIKVSVGRNGKPGNDESEDPAINADGSLVFFESEASNLVEGDRNHEEDVFGRRTGLNRPPEAVDDHAMTLQDTPIDINVLSNDTDPDGDTLRVTELQGTTGATVGINPDGTVRYAPTPGFYGVDTFTYTIDDRHGGSASAEVTVNVKRRNNAPVVHAGPDLEITLPVRAATLMGKVTDDGLPEGATLSILWSKLAGPGDVVFENPASAVTTATFPGPGVYELRLTGDDTEFTSHDDVSITVKVPPVPIVSVADASVVEGDDGTTDALLLVSLSNASSQEVKVDFRTADGTAAAGCDYLSRNGRLSFSPGETSKTVRLPVVGDLAVEPAETFGVILENPVGALLGDAEGTVVIENDDVANLAPAPIADRFPGDGAKGLSLNPVLTWSSSDPDGDPVTYDVYFGTSFTTTGQAWARLCAAGGVSPRARAGAAFAYDDVNDRLILFSGESVPADVWLLANATGAGGPSTWASLAAAGGPAARQQAAAGYDPETNRLLLHGGCSGSCDVARADAWVLTNANGLAGASEWIPLPDAPVARMGHGAAYDAASGRLIVFGGSAGEQDPDRADVWILKDANGVGSPAWEELQLSGGPVPRRDMSVVYDPQGNRLIIFGGRSGNTLFNDVWVLSNANGLGGTPEWRQVTTNGTPPGARWGHRNIFDPASQRMLVFSGAVAGAVANDAWMLTLSGAIPSWVQLAPGGDLPPGRLRATVAYSPSQNRMLVAHGQGALSPSSPLDDVRVLREAVGSLPLVSANQAESRFRTETPAASATYFWRVLARDSRGATRGSPAFRFRPNREPQVNAGSDQSIELPGLGAGKATLQGTVTDDGLPPSGQLTVLWTQVEGPGQAEFSNPTSLNTELTIQDAGAYVLRLSATDGELQSSDDIRVTFIRNQAPKVNAGPDRQIVPPQNRVQLDGSVTDDGLPTGSTLRPTWSKLSGPGTVTFTSPATEDTDAIFDTAGTYVLRLSASDGDLTGRDDVQVIVRKENQPPMVDAGPDRSVQLPANRATLNGAVADDGLPLDNELTITWSRVIGPGEVSFSAPNQPVTEAIFTVAGTYLLRLTANDGQFVASDDVRVAVRLPLNDPPKVDAGPNQIIVFPNPAVLKGVATDDGAPSGILKIDWTQVSGPGTAAFADARSAETTATFSARGVYVLRLTATDTLLTRSDDVSIFVGQVDCTRSNKGTDFWLMFLGLPIVSPPETTLKILVSGESSTSGSVNVPGLGFSKAFTVVPGQVTVVDLPLTTQVDTTDVIENKGIHVTAELEIAVYGLMFLPFTADGFLALPTLTLGTEYINLAYENGAGISGGSTPGTAFGLVATENDTTVTIMPAARAGARAVGTPYTLRLNQGQTYQLRNLTDVPVLGRKTPPIDLTGSLISADKPVAVMGGHACAFVPNGYWACNHLVEQLPPVDLWGQNFVTMPLATERKGDSFRFLASRNDTHVEVNGVEVAQLNRGEFHEQVMKERAEIRATHPILVAQYANGTFFSGNNDTDPSMILVPPFEHFGGKYTIGTPTTGFDKNFVNVIAPASAVDRGEVLLDGTPLPAAVFQRIGESGFSGSQLSITKGSHTLSSSLPFGITSYGFAAFDAYGYSGGVCLATGARSTSLTLTPATATEPITSEACVTATLRDAFSNPMGGIGVSFRVTGVHPTTRVLATDATGTARLCYVGVNKGSDLITASAGDAAATATVTWISDGPNQPPRVNSGPDQSISLPATTLQLNGSVIDDGLPVNGKLTFSWTQLSGPGSVTFSPPDQPITGATFSTAGTYELQLAASDSELTATDTVTVTVYPPNQSPVVNAGKNLTLAWFRGASRRETLRGTVTDDGLPAGSTLTIRWSLFSGPDSVFLFSPDRASTQAEFVRPGIYVFRLTATDGQFEVSSFVTFSFYDIVIDAGPDVRGTVGQSLTLNGSVTVNGQPPSADDSCGSPGLTPAWGQDSGPGQAVFSSRISPVTQVTFPVPGTYLLRLTVCTSLDFDTTTAFILPTDSPPPPAVAIDVPLDGAEIAAPTQVMGSVSGGNWAVEYSLVDESAPPSFVTLATGSSPVTNSVLATFDPTLLLNATYVIRLRTLNAFGQGASTAVTVDVTRAMKVGHFTLSFTDLATPLAGLPIQVIRTYDSRDKRQGDFGIGWTLSLRSARLQKNRNVGLRWVEQVAPGPISTYCLEPLGSRIVTVTFPDGKAYRFQATAIPRCQLAVPITSPTVSFVQLPGTAGTSRAKLEPLDGGLALVAGGIPGIVDLIGFNGDVYNPTVFKLTTAEGFEYVIDQKLGVTRLADPNGNTLVINASGITHSAGPSVAFRRDAQGRITQIADTGGRSMSYTYDGQSDLTAFTDRERNTTAFVYGLASGGGSNHLLTEIIDARGIRVIRNTYDASGRLTSTMDASNFSSMSYAHDIPGRRETVTDRLGNPTVYEYDDRGNVVRVTDALGNRTGSTYDDNDNLLSQTNALGFTTSYTYDAFGNRLAEKNALGHTTAFSYNERNQVVRVMDPRGNPTEHSYDARGNLSSTKDSLGAPTTFVYDTRGLLRSRTDALGKLTQFTYDGSGNVTSETDAEGTVQSYTYDGQGNRLMESVTRTTPQGSETVVTAYAYDRENRLVKTTHPDSSTTEVVYNALGQRTATVDELGRKTTFEYDNLGRLTRNGVPGWDHGADVVRRGGTPRGERGPEGSDNELYL